jgi:2EXR family
MDEIACPLALFQLLPDPNQDLSIQTLSEFTLFPKLPLALRQKIWRDTFPKGRNFYQNQLYDNVCLRQVPRPPISSQISPESRDETLRHYKILKLPRSSRLPNSKPEYIFWNPKTDSITCPWFDWIFLSLVTARLAQADLQWEHFIYSIASVEITCVQNLSGYSYDIDSFERELLKYPGLTELHVIDCRRENDRQEYGEITGDYLWFFKDLFIKRATSALDGRKYPMPRIIVSRR